MCGKSSLFVQPGELIAAEDLQCAAALPDSLCELALADPDEIITFVRQWAQTLSYGAEVRVLSVRSVSIRSVSCNGVGAGRDRAMERDAQRVSCRPLPRHRCWRHNRFGS